MAHCPSWAVSTRDPMTAITMKRLAARNSRSVDNPRCVAPFPHREMMRWDGCISPAPTIALAPKEAKKSTRRGTEIRVTKLKRDEANGVSPYRRTLSAKTCRASMFELGKEKKQRAVTLRGFGYVCLP